MSRNGGQKIIQLCATELPVCPVLLCEPLKEWVVQRKTGVVDMNMRMTLVAAALTGLAFGGAALAKADKPHGPRMTFEQLDTNQDGQITEAEMKAQGAARFAKADTNGDGFLTTSEIEAAGNERAKKRAAHMMERMDTDKDGKLSVEEMGKRHGRKGDMFAKFDVDNSGGLSKEEFDAAKSKMRKHRGGHKAESE